MGILSSGVQANETPRWELIGGTDASFAFTKDYNRIQSYTTASYGLISGLQATASVSYSRYSYSNSSDNYLSLLLGPTVNFPFEEDVRDAFFVSPAIGLSHGWESFPSASRSNTYFLYSVVLGKRFSLNESVAYTPSISFSKVSSFDATFTIRPVSFSFFF